MDNGATWPYSQFVDVRSGYSTLQIAGDGMIADLYEQDQCSLGLAKVDPRAVVADGVDNDKATGGRRGFCQKS